MPTKYIFWGWICKQVKKIAKSLERVAETVAQLRKCQSKLHLKVQIVYIKPLLKSWNVDPKHVLKLLLLVSFAIFGPLLRTKKCLGLQLGHQKVAQMLKRYVLEKTASSAKNWLTKCSRKSTSAIDDRRRFVTRGQYCKTFSVCNLRTFEIS